MRAIFYDTETTGVRSANDRIIELAAYDPERDRTFVELINPGCPIPAEASAVHHISDEMVADKPSFGEVGERFVQFCEGEVVLVAHNNDGFDKHFIRCEFERSGVTLPGWHYFDTLKWARRYRPDLPRHNLQFLRETYGFEANQAHRALDDVIILHKVYQMMVDDLTIDQAYALLNVKRKITTMPFGKYRGTPLQEVPGDYLKWLKESGALDKPDNEALKEALAGV